MDTAVLEALVNFQKNEITEYNIYKHIARMTKSEENQKILLKIADDEMDHYQRWKQYTKKDVKPVRLRIWFYTFISWLFGFTFAIKLMENKEDKGKDNYAMLVGTINEAKKVLQDEEEHEQALIGMLDEERLRYAGSVILGLNDALVELTGALAGLTLALQDTQLIALTGSITGVSAAFSMAASEYLATKTEGTSKAPLKASVYTGITYLFTVLILIFPYLVLTNYFVCLAITFALAVLVIAVFNFYISVAKDLHFAKRFMEMALLSFSVALVSFGISYLLKIFLHVDV